jgi:hypothetical protein
VGITEQQSIKIVKWASTAEIGDTKIFRFSDKERLCIRKTSSENIEIRIETQAHDIKNVVGVLKEMQSVGFNNKSVELHDAIQELLSNRLMPFERPDGYSIANNGIAYIFEHFIIDGSVYKKNGSTLIRNILSANSDNEKKDAVGFMFKSTSIDNLLKNFICNFNNHVNKIDSYKGTVLKVEKDTQLAFKIFFIITVAGIVNKLPIPIDEIKNKGVDGLIIFSNISDSEIMDYKLEVDEHERTILKTKERTGFQIAVVDITN